MTGWPAVTPGDTIPPQVVGRGEGVSPYRAKLPPEAVPVHLCGFDEGILVVRCHDLDVANVVAFGAFLEAHDKPRTSPAYLPFVTGCEGLPMWVRWVPDDPHDWTAAGAYERELRGTIGATPAVLFARPDTIERLPS